MVPCHGVIGVASNAISGLAPRCSAYLEQIRITIELTGSIEPEDLTPQAREDITELYRRWRSE